jgi:osmotically-inducible protein OsmY
MRKKERFMRKQLEVSRRLSTTELQLRVDYPDEDLRRRISSFLGSRHFPAFRRLEVSVLAGAVTVRGQVGSYYEKQVALDTCRRVAGVLRTIDQVEVEAGDGAAARGRGGMEMVRAGCVEPGGAGCQIQFPIHSGVSAF